jgi:hypothetical protein
MLFTQLNIADFTQFDLTDMTHLNAKIYLGQEVDTSQEKKPFVVYSTKREIFV